MNPFFTAIIIDDEPKATELLAESITSIYSNIKVIHTFSNWKEAITTLRTQHFDLLFLDVSMPQKTGMEILDLVPDISCEIIFVTAHAEFALEAFQYNACGYLLKPVRDKALTQTIDKALLRIQHKKQSEQEQATMYSAKIAIPNKNGHDYINVADIIYLEASTRYTRIVLKGKEILSSHSIGKFRQLLDSKIFFQVHRSYIANVNYITRYNSVGTIVMSDGHEIPVSKNVKDEFLNLFLKIKN